MWIISCWQDAGIVASIPLVAPTSSLPRVPTVWLCPRWCFEAYHHSSPHHRACLFLRFRSLQNRTAIMWPSSQQTLSTASASASSWPKYGADGQDLRQCDYQLQYCNEVCRESLPRGRGGRELMCREQILPLSIRRSEVYSSPSETTQASKMTYRVQGRARSTFMSVLLGKHVARSRRIMYQIGVVLLMVANR